MGEVIDLSESYRARLLIPAPWCEGGWIVVFKDAKERILALRKLIGYQEKYIERFLEIEKSSACMMRQFMAGSLYNNLALEQQARNFLASGAVFQMRLRLADASPAARGSAEIAQVLGEELRKKAWGLVSHTSTELLNDRFRQLQAIEALCWRLRQVLRPFMPATENSKPSRL